MTDSPANVSKTLQKPPSTGAVNVNGNLTQGVSSQTRQQIRDGQNLLATLFINFSNNFNDLVGLTREDLQGEDGARGPPGPTGQAGMVNVTYTEPVADEFPTFSVQTLASTWVLTHVNDSLEDITTSAAFLPLGGLSGDSHESTAFPTYHPTVSRFIPHHTSSYRQQNPIESVDIPNHVETPFHTARIIESISWNCPTAIAARFILVGKPKSGSNYWTKYYQVQGEKIFEEYPSGQSLISSERRNPSTDYTFSIPQANQKMPPTQSLAVILYDIRYVSQAQQAGYFGNHAILSKTSAIPSDQSSLSKQGISIKLVCKNYIPT